MKIPLISSSIAGSRISENNSRSFCLIDESHRRWGINAANWQGYLECKEKLVVDTFVKWEHVQFRLIEECHAKCQEAQRFHI